MKEKVMSETVRKQDSAKKSFVHAGAGALLALALLLIGTLNQPFTVKDGYWFAHVLNKKMLVDAFIAGSASNGNAIAEDVLTVGLNEFSPHHNLGRTSTAANAGTTVQNIGIVLVQQTGGFANATESMNTLLVGSSAIGSSALPDSALRTRIRPRRLPR